MQKAISIGKAAQKGVLRETMWINLAGINWVILGFTTTGRAIAQKDARSNEEVNIGQFKGINPVNMYEDCIGIAPEYHILFDEMSTGERIFPWRLAEEVG